MVRYSSLPQESLMRPASILFSLLCLNHRRNMPKLYSALGPLGFLVVVFLSSVATVTLVAERVSGAVLVVASVDLTADRHPVSDAIYGTNGAPTYMTNGNITGSTRMGGGDPTTVYN